MSKNGLTQSENKFPVVGVGASAGGLNAFKSLIKAIPKKSGMAYVLVQHLDPNHESLLTEILQKITQIPVQKITDDIKVQPDHIYIIPSNKILMADDGVLKLKSRPKAKKNKTYLPIDLFFSSLATVHQSHALGVVLSGSASDGTEGLRAIKDQGGLTFAQDEDSAEWYDMPRNAMEAGVVDFVLPPEKIIEKILEVVHNLNRDSAEGQSESETNKKTIRQILALLRIRHKTDFTYYKQTTIHRRILRRMTINKLKNTTDYLRFLQKNEREQDVLYQDLLIPVTSFFRDPKIFDNLCESTFPILLKNKKTDPLRVWVAGCSTGQEVYSFAICISELMNDSSSSSRIDKRLRKIQIFGTDISEPALSKARKGLYTKSEMEGLSPERINKFFTNTNGDFQINNEVREMCIFARHNFLKDPPFSKMDLISCRNVLIYMEPYLQKKAHITFHYALNPKGFLLLGKSETVGMANKLFDSARKGDKLYTKTNVPGQRVLHQTQDDKNSFNEQDGQLDNESKKSTNFQREADALILSEYTPAAVVVNELMDIVQFRGDTSAYLQIHPGKPSHNLFQLARKGLAFELRNIFHKAKKENKRMKIENIPINVGDVQLVISMEAIPLANMVDPHFLVLFHSASSQKTSVKTKRGIGNKQELDRKDKLIAQQEKELEHAREDMRGITEEQEASNEELQSANEELLSSSEELQSLNEELETSKEELQSTNEEIVAVNQELINMNEQIAHERDFAEAIINTQREPLLVLDGELRITTANPAFYKTFKVRKQDTEGRKVYNLGNNQWDIPKLRILLESILPETESIVDFMVTHTFDIIGERTMILNASQIKREKDAQKMIMLAIEDVTESKNHEAKERELLDRFKNLIVHAPAAIVVLEGKDYNVQIANDFYLQLVEKKKDFIGRPIFESLPELKTQGINKLLDKVMKSGKPYYGQELEVKMFRDKKSERGFYNFIYQPIKQDNQEVTGVIIVATEVTEQVLARRKVEESAHRFHELISTSPYMFAVLEGPEFILKVGNDAILNQLGKGKGIVGQPYLKAVPELEEQGLGDLLRQVYKTGEPFHANEMPVSLPQDGKMELEYYNFVYQPQRDMNGKTTGVAIIAFNVSPQAILNDKIWESEARYHQMADLMPEKIVNADAEGKITYFNKSWFTYTGLDENTLMEGGLQSLAHPDELETMGRRWENSLKSGDDFEMELRLQDKDGNYQWHLSRVVAVKDDEGTILSWIGAVTLIQKIKEEEKRKDDFLRMVSHELKTPLTSIKGYSQMLLKMLNSENKTPELDQIPFIPFLERIDNQVSRLTRLISEILDLSRMEEGKLDLKKETFNMNDLVEQSVQDISFSTEASKIVIVHDAKFEVNADKDRTGQVVINFITNALKYSPGNQNITVRIYKTKDNQGAVSVKDKGIGINKEDQKNIFKRFYRVSGKDEETYSGFGIGLFLVKEIVERHGGNIVVKSKKGKGSEFIFTLPL